MFMLHVFVGGMSRLRLYPVLFEIPQVCREHVSQKVRAGHNYLTTSGIFGGLTPGPSVVGKSDLLSSRIWGLSKP